MSPGNMPVGRGYAGTKLLDIGTKVLVLGMPADAEDAP